ncbi:3-hydroxyacyl-CoA dehydrogenase NAD-binding domain-containing protein, partial [Pseudomonas aeruginosa]|uniref:3-hydroxyacyl-CoA dehydrogenase NAD-binding domain-containing protein n=1 Tax=Pseudomonas aeruginosa TaxID=287 RepID=UPI003C6DC54C
MSRTPSAAHSSSACWRWCATPTTRCRSSADKMPLVEIIRGEKTSDETLARGFDYVLQIKKTP